MNKGISISGRVNTTSGGGSQATDLRRPRMITPFVRFVYFHNEFVMKYLQFCETFHRSCLVKPVLMSPTKGVFQIQRIFANLLFAFRCK